MGLGAKRYHLQALACLRLLACHTDCTFPRLLRGQLLLRHGSKVWLLGHWVRHYVPTNDQCADALTKNLSRSKVRRFAAALNGTSPLAPPVDSPPGRIGISLTNPASFSALDLL